MLITTVQRVNVRERAFRQWFIKMFNIDEREISEKKKKISCQQIIWTYGFMDECKCSLYFSLYLISIPYNNLMHLEFTEKV